MRPLVQPRQPRRLERRHTVGEAGHILLRRAARHPRRAPDTFARRRHPGAHHLRDLAQLLQHGRGLHIIKIKPGQAGVAAHVRLVGPPLRLPKLHGEVDRHQIAGLPRSEVLLVGDGTPLRGQIGQRFVLLDSFDERPQGHRCGVQVAHDAARLEPQVDVHHFGDSHDLLHA